MSALERGEGRTLEALAQLSDALSGVGAISIVVEAAELISGQAATMGFDACQGALTEKRTLGLGLSFEQPTPVR